MPTFSKNRQLWLFQSNFAPICVPIFSQNGRVWIFMPEYGEIAELRAIFCSNNVVQGVVENWLVTEMGWVELDRVRWSRVEMVARFSNTHKATYSTYSFIKQMMKIMQTWNKRKENDHTALRAVDYTVQWRLLLHKVKFSKMK